MEVLTALFGGTMVYSIIHFVVESFANNYKRRSPYMKFVTWYAIVVWSLFIVNFMYG